MSQNVTSGIVVVSGPQVTVNATPINIFGADPAYSSGRRGITDTSGALNVYFSGAAVSVSGDIVLVVSGGAIQVSGTVAAGILSGVVSVQSGSVSVASGQVIVTSGGTIPVNVVSGGGPTSVASGGVLPVWIASGAVAGLSGLAGVTGSVQVSGVVGVSGTVGVSGQVIVTSGGVLPTSLVSGSVAVLSGLYLASGINMLIPQQVSGTVGVSGQVAVTSGTVLPTYFAGYTYKNSTGTGIVNVQSGASVLHTLTVNLPISGAILIKDSLSGNAGTTVGTIQPAGTTAAFSVVYDAAMLSGIVLGVSGAMDITITYRNPP